jgi:methionyl-tRNA formyltransferase
MGDTSEALDRPRVLFFGMECDFSLPALQALLQANIDVCAVIIPTSETVLFGNQVSHAILPIVSPRVIAHSLPMRKISSSSLSQMAWEHHIPVWGVRKPGAAETLAQLSSYQPDIICVACFSKRIPPSLLALPTRGCLNVHPSLLPDNRGPLPLFWTFRFGHALTGVTIHMMTDKLDSGPILAQEKLPVPEGIRYGALEMHCANLGGQLLARTTLDFYHKRIVPQPQNEALSSYHIYPTDDDYVVQAHEWSARHLYTFIRGVAGSERPVEILSSDRYLLATDALSYSLNDQADTCGEIQQDSHRIGYVICRDGNVRVIL